MIRFITCYGDVRFFWYSKTVNVTSNMAKIIMLELTTAVALLTYQSTYVNSGYCSVMEYEQSFKMS